MKVIIPQSKLIHYLSLVERITGKSFSLPILTHLLLETEANFLSLKATDLEIGIRVWVLAKVEEKGTICLPASLLTNFVKLLPEGPLLLETKENSLRVELDKLKTVIKGTDPTDFPIIPEEKNQNWVTLPASTFCQALAQIAEIPIISSARPEISGIFFLFQEDVLTMATTDSFRLAEKTLPLTEPLSNSQSFSFILPQKAARETINIFGERGFGGKEKNASVREEIKLFFGPNQILLESLMPETSHPEINFVSRLVEGDYPNYQEIIPKKYETQAILKRNEFLQQIKLASIFSGKINEIKLKVNLDKQIITILSQSPEAGEHQSSLSGRIKGKEKEVSFNHRFLADGLEKIKSSEVIFELTERNGEIGPGVLRPVADPSYLYVLMPMQTS